MTAGFPTCRLFLPVCLCERNMAECAGGREVHPPRSMLVLTRKSNQSIMIGDDIEVSVLSIMGEKVRIGIQAPRDIPVFRKEVYLEIQEERARDNVPAGGVRAEVDDALHRLGSGG
jgi:carbon storage regulator